MLRYVLLCAITILISPEEGEGVAVLRENGYEGVVVAIGDQVKEDPNIIKNLKKMFEEGSKVLFEATRRRAYFREVTIVVPPTWPQRQDYNNANASGIFSEADIRIDLPHPIYGSIPYTLQSGGCGEPAAYTHFSYQYTSDMYGSQRDTYGPPGKVLVHEWAHLRWGVFDEYGEPGTPFPAFYVDEDLEVHSTGCTAGLRGWLLTDDGEKCHSDSTGLPDSNCHFFPASQNNVNGSLMNLYFLDSVSQFCDNEDIPHNSRAPSAQNLRCDGKSTWEVISNHEDFSNDTNPPRTNISIGDLTPKFNVIQELRKGKPRFVLLLDLSQSMDMYMTTFYQEVVRFVRDLIPSGSHIAVISFASKVYLNVNYMEVTDANREDIVRRLPMTYIQGGCTATGAAVRRVLELVEEEDIQSEGLMVVLITDGAETVKPEVSEFLPQVKSEGIVINTISLGPNATDKLEHWASETGGRSYYHRTDSMTSTSSLDAIIFDSIIKSGADSSDLLLQVHRDVVKVNSGKEKSIVGEITLDSSLGHLTKFTFTEKIALYNNFSLHVRLNSPDGEEYGETSNPDIYHEDNITRTITFSIPEAKAGRWLYNVSNWALMDKYRLPDDVFVAVTSHPNHKAPEEPIRVKAWMAANNISYPMPATVYAHVSQGYSIVVNANVTSLIEPPTDDSTIQLPLLDDGVGADLLAGDGIYSAYFTQFSGNGRYSLSAIVSTTNLTAKVQGHEAVKMPLTMQVPNTNAIRLRELPVPENSISKPAESKFPIQDLEPPTERDIPDKQRPLDKVKVEPFTRYTSGGIFKVSNYHPGDLQPPGQVMDLTVVSVSLYEATVMLKWTSPGDDLYHGTAKMVDLRYHETRKISQKFKIGHRINESHLIAGDLTPLPAGLVHSLTVKILERTVDDLENKPFFFGVRAQDEEGNLGHTSNIVVAYFPMRKYARNIKEEERVNAITGLVVLAFLGVMILGIVAFIATVKLLHIRNKKKKRSQELIESPYRYYNERGFNGIY